ncbi:DNA repair exonuclease [Acetobacter sp. DmW_136]|uniref:metallophosphoesterase family protein n=1 Tax=Acetobacter sp. DmW_136 TaxID=2591091 RepID=UPI00123A3E6E|nr:DNA repair exonuclease [Acetobacter sp. DmW_136]KAA8386254.1 DNA repair exonuclease [Acetobacter sp. DmW_136]
MKFIHTSDWQIGKTFSFADDDTLGALQAARVDVVRTIGALARQEGVTCVLVAGDIYEHETPERRTLHQPMERMRQFPDVQWHLIPGNHDADTAEGVWARLRREDAVPDNVHLHTCPQAVEIDKTYSAWLLPAVLKRRHTLSDLTDYMNDAATPPEALRIGLAHGSVVGFSNGQEAEHNPIALDRAKQAGLAYLGLGDWHGFCQIDAHTCYSGTPETDRFVTGGAGGGETLVVSVDGPCAQPVISRHRTGKYLWRKLEDIVLTNGEDIEALEARVRSINPDNPSVVMAWLEVSGLLGVDDLRKYESVILSRLQSAVACLRITGAPQLVAGAQDLERLEASATVKVAAQELLQMVEQGGEEGAVAREALQRLFLFWHEVEGAAA